MRLTISGRFKFIIEGGMNPFILCGLLFGAVLPRVHSASVAPQPQNTVMNVTLDRMGLPKELFIWNDVFGGSTDIGVCTTLITSDSCKDQDFVNSLVCLPGNNELIGSCPTSLFWPSSNKTANARLTLRFTHTNGQTKDLDIRSIKTTGTWPSWIPDAPLYSGGFSTSILSSELKKLSIPGIWRAQLIMMVKAWDDCSTASTDGCPGNLRAFWQADITLNVTDKSNQQIYLPAFPTSAPVINLNLNTRPGAGGGKTVSGSTSLDMCLYDGNDSASNRINLLLQDEGVTAAGRPAGQFSIYRRGGDKSKAGDRLDYQVSVINPTTGAAQRLANGTEIIWSDTNKRNIQRQVILPGVSKPALCVPAPLTLTTPAFSLSDKTSGDYTGTLRIIYMPSTKTAQ
ncbi:CfaE/CblD family pilus tip adhesin [Serratia silvae]|uniref:Phage tail protein n=1 Tax=Serratia silvae TaxID=2824122 RepID=A0ABT0K6W4_9GAMM|nr:CfaE/CblD family pilus tip adhesin [Serratia silvae]MCL1027741.1 phage tail protein [Serratia silvae]